MRIGKPDDLGFAAQRQARIGTAMQGYIESGKIAGTLSLVAHRGQVVHFERCGMMNIASGKPMDFDVDFRNLVYQAMT